jgi:transposase-like protein
VSAVTTELIPQVSATYRDYSPEFKAAAIAAYEANNCNLTGTAKELSIPFQTLDYWVRTADRNSHFQSAAKEDLATECEKIAYKVTGIAHETLDNPERAAKIPFAALMTGGAVAIDKMLLLRGQPTQITATIERNSLTVVLASAIDTDSDTDSDE